MNDRVLVLMTAWAVTTVLVGGAIVGGGMVVGRRAGTRAKLGWNLTPAVVAARDLTVGTLPRATDFELREVPEQLVTESVVSRDATDVAAGRRLTLPARRGDLILTAHFASPRSTDCVTLVTKTAELRRVQDEPSVRAFLEALRVAQQAEAPDAR